MGVKMRGGAWAVVKAKQPMTVEGVTSYSTVARHSTVQYSTVQYSTVQYSTVQYSIACHRITTETGNNHCNNKYLL